MSFDAKVPLALKELQIWFGAIISRPIDENNQMNPLSPKGIPMDQEASTYIVPSPTLKPAERIQIYNQQYWWRLMGILQDIFPTLLRLFGSFEFNQVIATPYLDKYPPQHWSLNKLGDRLVNWIEEEYHAKDKQVVHELAKIDWAFNDQFFTAHYPPLDASKAENPDDLLHQPMTLQPHVHLFTLERDFFALREEFLKHPAEYWVENDFPKLPPKEKCTFVLYRNSHQSSEVKKVTFAELHFLSQFESAKTIDQACQWLEEQPNAVCEEAAAHLQEWLQSWTLRQWIYPS